MDNDSMVKQRTSQIVEKQLSSKFNVSVASNPYLMKFWDKERNTVDPTMVSAFDSREAFWRCKTCNYGWVQTIQNRNTAKRGKCPCHEMQRVTSDDVYPGYFHSFGELNPRIAPFFNDELNNGITPYKGMESRRGTQFNEFEGIDYRLSRSVVDDYADTKYRDGMKINQTKIRPDKSDNKSNKKIIVRVHHGDTVINKEI